VFGEFGGLGPLGGVFPPPPGLLAHLGCILAIGAQWVAPLTGKKKKNFHNLRKSKKYNFFYQFNYMES